MELNCGYVQKYNSHKGFGFVKRSLSKDLLAKDIFFHISKIKSRYPEIAKQFDAEAYHEVFIWYSLEENNKGKCVDEVWISFQNIPEQIQDKFRNMFSSIANSMSLKKLQDSGLLKIGQEILDDAEYKVLIEQKQEQTQENKKIPQNVHTRKSREPNRVFVNYLGLPEYLYKQIFEVSREWRTHEWSHIPGGCDVIVEYTDGRVHLYDWIKYPDRYIQSFFDGIVDYPQSQQIAIAKNEITRIFSRFCENEEDMKTTKFEEVWNSENANTTPWDALKNFKIIKEQEKIEDVFSEDDLYDLAITPNWSVDRYQFENLSDYAEAVWGIPDPRLVEDF